MLNATRRVRRATTRARTLIALLRRRVARVAASFAVVYFAATGAVYYFEHGAAEGHFPRFADALWFGVVTLSTVGYGDLYPVTPGGRAVTVLFILVTLLTFGFVLTAFNDAILEVKRMEELGLIGTQMQGHVLVCGFGPLARTAIEELLAAGRPVAVLCENQEALAQARQYATRGDLFVSMGEPSQDVLRDRMNLSAANTAVVVQDDDAKNLIATLNIRAVNPKARIIVALHREELRQTLEASGVTYVATPNELGGRLVASAAFEPQVARLVEDMASGATGSCDVQQLPPGPLAGLTVGEARHKLDADDGPLLLGLARRREGRFEVLAHPRRTERIQPDDLVLVMTRLNAG